MVHLPGPATVEVGGTFWCGRLGAPVDTALCTGRHTARTHVSAGYQPPTYRACAECPEGAALVARIGVQTRPDARRLPLFTDAPRKAPEAPMTAERVCAACGVAAPDHAKDCAAVAGTLAPPPNDEEPMAAKTEDKQAHDDATPTVAECTAKGCDDPQARTRTDTPSGTEDLCSRHRRIAHSRARDWKVTHMIAAQTLRDGVDERPGAATTSKATKKTSTRKAPTPPRVEKTVPRSSSALSDALARVQLHASVIERLGGIDSAQQLAEIVVDVGGVTTVIEALTTLRGLA